MSETHTVDTIMRDLAKLRVALDELLAAGRAVAAERDALKQECGALRVKLQRIVTGGERVLLLGNNTEIREAMVLTVQLAKGV